MIVLEILLLVVGMVLLIKGADWFVDGASQIAKAMKIPSLIIGLTLVSIGTSTPELSVSVNSSIQGLNDMSFGNVIGSNIFNTFMVIGVSALFTPMVVSKGLLKGDMPVLVAIYLVTLLFGFVVTPFVFDVWEGIILLVLLVAYTVFLIYRGKKENALNPPKEEETKLRKWYINLLLVVVGLASIVFGGDFVVDNASKLAVRCGMSEFLVALTIVAIGTSLPELVTSIVASKKGENDIAVGNAIGSCLFNIVLILGLSASISPMTIGLDSLIDIIVMIISALLIIFMSVKSYTIGKWKGVVLISVYVVYFAYIVLRNFYPVLSL